MNFQRYPSTQTVASVQEKDAPVSETKAPTLSDFIAIQSFNNLSSMTAIVTIIWLWFQTVAPIFLGHWFPFLLSVLWGFLLLYLSYEGFKDDTTDKKKKEIVVSRILIIVNVFVLYGSVTGVTNFVVSSIGNV